ncbi:MAG: PQQ-binding-like beta-propeller repeat protein [Limisphaerales bacterium]
MEVKVQCGCGTRFAFDIEPVNGRMPVRVNCPGCGADGTDLANEAIRQKLAATVAAAPVAPVPQAAAAAVAAASVTFCPRHPKNPSTETCRVCGKPICGECMEQFGYVCSTLCRKRAEQTGMDVPVYGKQRAVIEARLAWMAAWILRVAVFLVAVLAGAWIWYTFFGSQPRVIYSEKLPHGDRARFYQLLVPNQVLSIKANQMTLFDLAQQKQLWSAPLNVEFSAPVPLNSARDETGEPARLYPEPHVIATTNDLWLLFPNRIAQYDRHTGSSKQEIPLNPPFFGLAQSGSGLTVISSDESGRQTIARIAFSDGTVQTAPFESGAAGASPSKSQPPAATIEVATNSVGYAMLAKLVAAKAVKLVERTNWGDKFVPDGADVVQMKVDLIERKTIIHQAMKARKKSLVDDNLTSGQSLEASEQMINDLRRDQTGGVEEEDASRYQVTLRRLPIGSAPDWTGEVIGPPSFFALKARDVLVAGNSVQVFDKNNKKLWTASLTYSVPPHYSEDFATEADPPCVESDNTLYVFDRGMLTSFDAATGQVHWRLTSVGISQVQPDGQGHLYVTSTTASPDAIQFSQQFNLSSKVNPVILKVEATTGRVLWRNEGIGAKCFLSGKFIYAARAAKNPLITPGEDPVLYFDLCRLSPSDGHTMWDYSQSRHPVQIEVQGNQILLHFRGELQVLKFFSL